MLSDNIIHVAQRMLKAKYPDIKGLQDPVLGQTFNYDVFPDQPSVQILHDGQLHWVTISTIGCDEGQVYLLDSMFNGRIAQHTQRQICAILHCSFDKINVTVLPVQQQTNGIDCGVYAIAFAHYIVENKDYPAVVAFDQVRLRNHLLKSIKDNEILPFPTTDRNVIRCKQKEVALEIFCSCRMIWVPSDKNVYGR